MGDYNLSASQPAGVSGYGPGTSGSTFPRQAITSLTQTSWGSGITWDSVNLRVNIATAGTMYVMAHGSCTVTASTTNGNVGLAIYKNGVKISTGTLGQYTGSATGQPFPLSISWIGSVVNSDNLQLYLVTSVMATLTVSDVVFSVQTAGGSGMTNLTSLNSCNPQWSLQELTADNATTLSTTEVSALLYLTTHTANSVDAIRLLNPAGFNLLKLGVYSIYVNLQFKSIAATSQAITVRLKIGGVTIVTRQVLLPTAANGYFGGTIYYGYTLASGTQTVDVTVQSSVINNYLIARGSTVIVKLIQRNV